jgi:hypothetical protein
MNLRLAARLILRATYRPVFLAAVALTALPSCRQTSEREYPTGGTSYLAPDGSIIGPAGNRQARPQSTARQAPPRREPVWRWEGDGVPGAPSIVIDLAAQTATFYKGKTAVGWTEISSGSDQHPTPPGSFRVQQKSANHVSNLYGDYVDANGNVVVGDIGVKEDPRPPGARFRGAPMPYFLRINGGIGLHAGYLPGYPASHGCIRLPRGAAEVFFRNAQTGTPVKVIR